MPRAYSTPPHVGQCAGASAVLPPTSTAALLIALIKGIDFFFATPAYAEEAAKLAPYINPINTIWTLVAAFLVFFMQAGFMCLEAGFARSRETVNILHIRHSRRKYLS